MSQKYGATSVAQSANSFANLETFWLDLLFGGVVSISPVIVRDPGRLVESERRRRQGYDEDLVKVAAPHTKVRWNVLNLAVEPAGVICRLNNRMTEIINSPTFSLT